MASKVRPLGDKILLKRVEAESKTKSGIVLPEAAKEKPKRGTVIAVGACAITGLPAGQRNNFTEEQKASIDFLVTRFGALPSVKKVSDVVKVDVEIPGCPMSPVVFLEKVALLVKELRG